MSHGAKLFLAFLFALLTLAVFIATLLYYRALIKIDERNWAKSNAPVSAPR